MRLVDWDDCQCRSDTKVDCQTAWLTWRFIAAGMTQRAEMLTTDYRQVVVVPSVGVQVMEPCWKSLRRPPVVAYSSLVGYPSQLLSAPWFCHDTRMAP